MINSIAVFNYQSLQIHPACLILPEMPEDDFAKLKNEISGLGLLHPITLFQGMILDGRHRYRACLELGIEPIFEDWKGVGMSVVDFVLAENLHRRHLTQSQKAMVAAKAIEYHREAAKERQKNSTISYINKDIQELVKEDSGQVSATVALPSTETKNVVEFPTGKAAATLAQDVGVSPRTVERAIFVHEQGTPNDVSEVATGAVSVNAKVEEIKQRKAPVIIAPDYITPDQWEKMSEPDRIKALSKPTDKKLNTQDNTSIDWAAYSWNPITGCNHDCQYCYARDIANRFYGEIGFKPAFHPDRLLIPVDHKASTARNNRVFTCSMADLFGAWVPKEWIEAVLSVCEESPQFDFLLLTKNPARLRDFTFPKNCWVGTTCDTQRRMDVAERIFADVQASVKWVSVEPMLEAIVPSNAASFDWYVIGGASPSSGQPGFIPPFDWVARLALAAIDAGSKVFIKTNFWENGRLKQFPGMPL